MSDNVLRVKPRQPLAALADLTTLVVVPGTPDAVRAFTAAENDEARSYAAAHDGHCRALPIDSATA